MNEIKEHTMNNRIISVLLTVLLLITLVACNKEDEEGAVGTFDPIAEGSGQEAGDDDPNAWWQQYTTQPSGTTKSQNTTKKGETAKTSQTTKKGAQTTKAKQTTTKANQTTKKNQTTKSSNSKTTESYTRVNANTMKYEVQGGFVTLTKDGSNNYVKQSVQAYNDAFGGGISSNNVMCFTSTVAANKNSALVFIFSSASKKNADTLKVVMSYEGGKVEAFGVVTSDDTSLPLIFWPCASSGDETYTTYRNTFKECYDSQDKSLYDSQTKNFKNLLSDEHAKVFLSW